MNDSRPWSYDFTTTAERLDDLAAHDEMEADRLAALDADAWLDWYDDYSDNHAEEYARAEYERRAA